MAFPVVMYGCETIKKAEHWRINAFELWCWRRLLRVPWTARRSNQSIRKEISSEYSLEGLMLKLKLQHFGHLMPRTDSLEKNPDAGKDWRQEEKETTEDEMDGWHHRLDGHEFEQTLGVGNGQESLACCSPWGHKELDTTEQLNWTESTSLGEQDRPASYIHVLGYIRMPVIFILPNDAGGQQSAEMLLVRLASKGWNDSSEKLDCNGTTAGRSCFLLSPKCFHRCQFPDSGTGRNSLCVTDTENITQVPQELRDLCPCACNTLSNHRVYPLR